MSKEIDSTYFMLHMTQQEFEELTKDCEIHRNYKFNTIQTCQIAKEEHDSSFTQSQNN